jgi:hypothetical protein
VAKPEHLQPVAPATPLAWLARRPAAVVAALLGVLSFAIVAITQPELWTTPDWRVSLPGFAAAVIASIVSLARRERGYWLWGLGLAIAAAALVLGWFMMVAAIVIAATVLIMILHAVM